MKKRVPSYRTGEPIQEGDVVKIGDLDGTVESIDTKDSSSFVDYIGEGVMLVGPAFGRLHTRFDDDDLIFVRRKS